MRILLRAARSLNRDLDPDLVLKELLSAAMRLVGATAGASGRLVGDELVFNEYNRNGHLEPIDLKFQRGHGVPGHVMQTFKPYICNVVAQDPFADKERCAQLGVYNFVTVPVISSSGDLLGCLELHNTRNCRPFNRLDLRALKVLAMLSAVALKNAVMSDQHQAAIGALRSSQEKFASLAQSSPDWIWEVDLQGRYTYASPAAKNLLGYEPSEIIAKRIYDLMAAPEAARVQDMFSHLCATHAKVDKAQSEVIHRDGHRVVLETSAAAFFDAQGKYLGYRGISRDITDRKRLQETLEAANENLERRVSERTAVANWRARQLRALASEITRAEDYERRRVAHVLHEQLQQLLVAGRLRVEDLLRSRPSPTQQNLLGRVHDILRESIETSRTLAVELYPPILHELGLPAALEWLAQQMQERYGLDVHVEADPQAQPEDEDLRGFLFQSARELLFNVVKHAHVKEASAKLSINRDARVELAVEDHGIGFDPQSLQSGEGEDGDSVGFGIFSIRERIEALGGAMELTSHPGDGTRVAVTAPLRGAVYPHRRVAGVDGMVGSPDERIGSLRRVLSSAPPKPGKIRVLLADDHAIMRQGLATLLEGEEDIQVIGEASDGQMAVDLAGDMHPDVIIMDVSMPGLNGIEATRIIRRQSPHVAVIGLSMHEDATIAAEMREAGADSYLTKGGPSEDLINAIRECVAAAKT
ncbi:MAG: response regulator [Planctomycetaceae bacterium]|nr:response regulator [Planctomycetaceae bacterium]